MSHSRDELDVWAFTEDYNLVVTEDDEGLLYGLHNRHTGIIEVKEAVFSNAVSYLIEIQAGYESAYEFINEDGSIKDDVEVVIKPTTKGRMH